MESEGEENTPARKREITPRRSGLSTSAVGRARFIDYRQQNAKTHAVSLIFILSRVLPCILISCNCNASSPRAVLPYSSRVF